MYIVSREKAQRANQRGAAAGVRNVPPQASTQPPKKPLDEPTPEVKVNEANEEQPGVNLGGTEQVARETQNEEEMPSGKVTASEQAPEGCHENAPEGTSAGSPTVNDESLGSTDEVTTLEKEPLEEVPESPDEIITVTPTTPLEETQRNTEDSAPGSQVGPHEETGPNAEEIIIAPGHQDKQDTESGKEEMLPTSVEEGNGSPVNSEDMSDTCVDGKCTDTMIIPAADEQEAEQPITMETTELVPNGINGHMNGVGPPQENGSDSVTDDGTPMADQKEEHAAFVLASVYDDDIENDWRNQAHAFYAETTGQDKFEEKIKDEFKSANTGNTGLMSEIGLKLKKTKLSYFYNSGTLSPEGKTHLPRAVGGAGFITIVNKDNLPAHPFFRRGSCFRARLRHANLTFRDDAMLDGRVVCLKFADQDNGGPLDFVFHTGRVAQFYNAKSFEQYLAAVMGGVDHIKDWCMQQPSQYYGRVENVRRDPVSYYDQRYYSHVTYDYLAEDGTPRWARLRLIPADGCEESGLTSAKDQQMIWFPDRRQVAQDEDYIAKDYLRHEYYYRLIDTPLQYRLQIQLRESIPEESVDALNPCYSWDRDKFPWLDLAIVTIALPLCEEVVAKTKYSLTNHPPSFRLPECHSVDDFTSLPYVVSEFHGNLEAGFVPDDVDTQFLTKYTITVVTGKVGNAGTDADVYITLTGSQGRTKCINLDNSFRDDFELGQTDQFEVEATPVGEIVTVQVELRSILPGREWYLDDVTVKEASQEKEWRFPCYKWLTTSGQSSVLLRRAEGILVQQEHSIYSTLQRKYELDERQKLYQWEKREGLPSRMLAENYHSLPKEAKFNQEKVEDLRGKYMRTLTNTGVGTIKSFFEGWDALTDYEKLLTSLLKDKDMVRKVSKVWMEDGEFGRQCLNGVHPTRIRRISQLPEDFAVTNDHVHPSLDRDLTLEQEMQEGNIYLLSYQELITIVKPFQEVDKPNRHIAVPYCLLYVRKSGQLVPIAIQLTSNPDQPPMLWTPQDEGLDWLFAKMWVREADAQTHQIISRHLKTHLVMEVICVATQRQLPSVHPVYKLLIPHLRYTIAVNVLGRQSLYPPEDGLFEKYLATGAFHKELIQEAYKNFSMHDLNVPRDLEARGVDASSSLRDYHYREDALELWGITKKFVRTMLILHYWTPENVYNDMEIQNWVRDIQENGFPSWSEENDHGVPSSFKTLEELIEFVTTIIFTASCQNSALTGGMMDYYGYSPNMPTVLYKPPQEEKGKVDRDFLMDALPSKTKTAEVIAACYTLSRFSRDELFLGQFPQGHFTGEDKLLTIQAFQEELLLLTDRIAERNSKLDMPYPYLSPDRIPNSIAN